MAKDVAPQSFTPLEDLCGQFVIAMWIWFGLDTLTFGLWFASIFDINFPGSLMVDQFGRIALFMSMMAAAVFMCMWMAKAYWNLMWFKVSGLAGSPTAAVSAWFIPIVNLVRPYQHTSELWKASDPRANDENWVQANVPMNIKVWWGLWVSTAIVSVLGSLSPDPIVQIVVISGAEIGNLACALLIIGIVKHITARQHQKYHAMKPGLSYPDA